MALRGWLLALVVGVATFHDLRHLVQVAKVVHAYRLPLCVLSTAVVTVRIAALWWSYWSGHVVVLLVSAGIGQILILLAYRVDLGAVRFATERAERKRQTPNSQI